MKIWEALGEDVCPLDWRSNFISCSPLFKPIKSISNTFLFLTLEDCLWLDYKAFHPDQCEREDIPKRNLNSSQSNLRAVKQMPTFCQGGFLCEPCGRKSRADQYPFHPARKVCGSESQMLVLQWTYMPLLVRRQMNHRVLPHESPTGALPESWQYLWYRWEVARWLCNTAQEIMVRALNRSQHMLTNEDSLPLHLSVHWPANSEFQQ